ncbi:MAG: rhomboid family intramembrane serine protease [Desulfopila sp.]|jgi:membrane associated rhomboid family serine protease|nr:rhomboid family intramembrane serine protease [Desulfopila sp.]
MTNSDQNEKAIAEADTPEELSSLSLVLSAVQIRHTISTRGSMYVISVDAADAEKARYHLDAYQQENSNWPPQKIDIEQTTSVTQPYTLIVVAALVLFHGVTGPWTQDSIWFSNGAGDSTAILHQGEYFRLLTALTLHADITHLLGNCFLGGFCLHFFFRSTGAGLGCFAVLLAALLGNYVNVFLRGEGHHFVGFSTAVFATIGMLAMNNYHSKKNFSKLQVAVPFMAGAALLAMTGSSGERTDLGAHLFGLLSGFFIGRLLITETLLDMRKSSFLQLCLFLTSAFAVYWSWEAAMAQVY